MIKLKRAIALFVSFFFHPLLMPSFGVLIILSSGTYLSLIPIEIKRIVFYAVLIITFILPLLMLFFLKFQGMIKDFSVSERNERILPLTLITIVYFIGYYFFSRFSFVPHFIVKYVLAIAVTLFIALVVSLKMKISLHMIGIGGIIGLLFVLMKFNAVHLDLFFISTFIMAGLIAFARLNLNEHNPLQVYSGFFSGILIVFSVFLF